MGAEVDTHMSELSKVLVIGSVRQPALIEGNREGDVHYAETE